MGAILSPYSSSPIVAVPPSGDTTGVADAAAITAAVAKLPVQGGTVALDPSAQWYIKCGNLSINRSGVYLWAPGTYINAVGTGDVIRMKDTSAYSARTVYGGGVIGAPVIDGTSAGAGSAGLHIGDILQLQVDVAVQNFTGAGSIGVHFDNASFWTEQMRAHVYAHNCTTGVIFDVTGAVTSTGSYDRCLVEVNIDQVGPTFDGVTFQNGANLSDGAFALYGNFAGSASVLTSAALRITGVSPAGHPDAGARSAIKQSRVDIGCECSSAAHTPSTMIFGTTANVIGNCYGNIDFGLAGNNFTAASQVSSLYTFFGQVTGDSVLAAASGFEFGQQFQIPGGFAIGDFSSASVTASSGTISTSGKGTTKTAPTGNITAVVLQAGSQDGQQVTVVNEAAFTVTFAAAGTSNVADGTSDVIPALTSRLFTWDFSTALWYRAA